MGKRDSTSSTGERRTLTQSPPPIGNTVSLPTQSPPMPSNLAAPALSNNKRYSTLALPRPSSSQPRAGTAPLGAVPGATLSAPLQDHLRSTSSPMPRSETLDVPSDRSSKPLQKRRSFDDRPLNVLLQDSVNTIPSFTNPSPNGNLLPPETTARRDKRRSINPAVAMSFNSPPQSSSPTATSFSGSHTVPVQPEVPPNRVSSPREVFSAPRTLSPSPLQDGSYPPVSPPHSYPSHLVPIRPLPDPLTGRARSASASTFVDISRSPGPDRPNTPNRQDATLDKVPTRTSSRGDFHARPATSGGLRSQNSFDERSRSGTPTFHSRPSSLNQTIEIPMRSRSSSGPASPAHHVDVPHSIESGTDTEGEKEEDLRRHSRNGTEPTSELPPLPPPKEGKGSKVGTRPPELKLGPSDIDNDNSDTGPPDSEDISELSHESSPVEQTSHATFIAPALPPIRFSMSGADFSDLLKSVGTHQSNKSLERVPEVTGDGTSRNRAIAANTPPSTARTATPTSDITVLAPGEPGVDVAPMKRNEARRNGRSETDQTPRRNQSLPRSGSPSPDSSPSSSNDHTMTIGRSRDTSDAPKRSLDLSELSGVSDASRSSVDLPASGHSRTLSNVRNGLPARPAPEGRSSHQRSATAVALSGSATEANGPAQITVTSPDNATSKLFNKLDTSDLVRRRLQEAVGEATNRGATHVKLNMEFINAILMLLEQRKDEYNDMSRRLDGMKVRHSHYAPILSFNVIIPESKSTVYGRSLCCPNRVRSGAYAETRGRSGGSTPPRAAVWSSCQANGDYRRIQEAGGAEATFQRDEQQLVDLGEGPLETQGRERYDTSRSRGTGY